MGKSGSERLISEELIQIVQSASRVAVLTGSGISAESGIPTFRDAQTGLWAQYDPHELVTRNAFERDPDLVWRWYDWRRKLVAKATPNCGHVALVHLEESVPDFQLITQNVDNLHFQAGNNAIIELHGNIFRFKCFASDHPVDRWDDVSPIPPRCDQCDSLVRPDVVWFGESLPTKSLEDAIQYSSSCDLFLSIGTSSVIQPAATLAHYAIQGGATIVEINLNQTPLSSLADFRLSGAAGDVLPALVEASFPT